MGEPPLVSLNQRPLSSTFLHQALLLPPIHSNLPVLNAPGVRFVIGSLPLTDGARPSCRRKKAHLIKALFLANQGTDEAVRSLQRLKKVPGWSDSIRGATHRQTGCVVVPSQTLIIADLKPPRLKR